MLAAIPQNLHGSKKSSVKISRATCRKIQNVNKYRWGISIMGVPPTGLLILKKTHLEMDDDWGYPHGHGKLHIETSRIFGLPKKDGFVLVSGELPKLLILRFQLLDLTFLRILSSALEKMKSENQWVCKPKTSAKCVK